MNESRWARSDPFLWSAANRETAFVQAIISAGIVHTVTRNCRTGEANNCKCLHHQEDSAEAIQKGFRWGGCSDSIELGSKIAIAYLERRETGQDLKAQVRLHNNQVGRDVSGSERGGRGAADADRVSVRSTRPSRGPWFGCASATASAGPVRCRRAG